MLSANGSVNHSSVTRPPWFATSSGCRRQGTTETVTRYGSIASIASDLHLEPTRLTCELQREFVNGGSMWFLHVPTNHPAVHSHCSERETTSDLGVTICTNEVLHLSLKFCRLITGKTRRREEMPPWRTQSSLRSSLFLREKAADGNGTQL